MSAITSTSPSDPSGLADRAPSGPRPNTALIVALAGSSFSVFGWFAVRWTESNPTVLPWLLLVCGLGSTLLLLGHVRSIERASQALETFNGRLRLEVEIRKASEASLQSAKEAAENADAAKSRFLVSASQDLRQPLASVLRGLDRILLAESEERRREEVQLIKRSATSTLDILDELLDLTQTHSDSLQDVSQSFDPRALIQAVVQPLAGQARSRGLQLDVVLDESLPMGLLGNTQRLRQIVTRLVNNAVELTPQGAVTLTASAAPLDDQRVLLQVGVSDAGAGISMEEIARACAGQPRTEDGAQAPYSDLRRGLTIAHLLVRKMNGRLDVAHRPGGGSTFSFEVPLHHAVQSGLLDGADYSLTPPIKASRAGAPEGVPLRR